MEGKQVKSTSKEEGFRRDNSQELVSEMFWRTSCSLKPLLHAKYFFSSYESYKQNKEERTSHCTYWTKGPLIEMRWSLEDMYRTSYINKYFF